MERIALQRLIGITTNTKSLWLFGAQDRLVKLILFKSSLLKTITKIDTSMWTAKKEDEIREFCSGTANAEKIIEYIL